MILSRGVIGNTTPSEGAECRFDPCRDNKLTSGRTVIASPFEGDTERFKGSNPLGSSKLCCSLTLKVLPLEVGMWVKILPTQPLTSGVIGNTSDFGSEEYRFETCGVNYL